MLRNRNWEQTVFTRDLLVCVCRSALNSSFEQDYLDMLSIFKALPSNPVIHTMTTCPLWNGEQNADFVFL